ncbi:MAG: LPS assembly protein LptD [Gammaproteobacteria bacterium]|nr:LPS assembly protein LptD [Gammaproteobacteria bacterium]
MNSNGNKNSSVETILLLPLLLFSFSLLAATEDTDEWQGDFFHQKCPGPSDQVNGVFKNETIEINPEANIKADNIKTDPNSGKVTFMSNVRYEDNLLRLTSESINLDLTKKSFEIEEVKFQLINGNMRGEADFLRLNLPEPIKITDAKLTSCPPGNESWSIQSSDVTIDPVTGWGVADDIIMRIGEIPIFYFPTLSFPLDDRRKSGLLYPSLGNSTRNGFEVEIPWYWNIAPDKDATLAPRYLSKRGLMLGGEYRQLTEEAYIEIYAEYLPNDDMGIEGKEDRFFYNINSEYASGDHWRGQLKASSMSDHDYFYDFGSNVHSGNRELLRRGGELHYDTDHLSFISIISNDMLFSSSSTSYKRLPQLGLSLLYPVMHDGLQSNIHLEATVFRHDTKVDAERMVVIPELSYPFDWAAGYIHPNLKLHYSHYSQEDPELLLGESVNRSIPIFSVDSGLFFERNVNYSNKSFIQTLEPRLYYLYVPEEEQDAIGFFDTTSANNGLNSLFRENRFSGSDRISDSNQFSLAISSALYEQGTGQEHVRFSIGRAYYLDHREINLAVDQTSGEVVDLGIDTREKSPLISNLQMYLFDNWKLEGELAYDPSNNKTEKGVVGLHYQSAGLILNFRHRINRYKSNEVIEQAEFSMVWPINDKLSFVGRWHQELREDRTIDSFAGLEYESCCWAVRLVARRYLNIRLDQQGIPLSDFDKYNDGIYLEFILKGLTNVGKNLDLETDIQGYEDRFSH